MLLKSLRMRIALALAVSSFMAPHAIAQTETPTPVEKPARPVKQAPKPPIKKTSEPLAKPDVALAPEQAAKRPAQKSSKRVAKRAPQQPEADTIALEGEEQAAAPVAVLQTIPLPPRRTKVAAPAALVVQTEPAPVTVVVAAPAGDVGIKQLVSFYAQQYNVPDTLAHRIVIRESRYNPAVKGRGHYGLMQISLPTARQMGYAGAPQGLLDARTNLAHGMPYLANAWIVSGGSETRAVSLYSRGYYYDAKRKGLLRSLHTARSSPAQATEVEAVAIAR